MTNVNFDILMNRDVILYLIHNTEDSVVGRIVGTVPQGIFFYSQKDNVTYFYAWNIFYLETAGNVVTQTKAA